MKTYIVIAAILLLGLGLFAIKARDNSGTHYQTPTAGYATPAAGTSTDGTVSHSDLIRVTSLKAGDRIASPLTVRGEARGPWYFEASFPVKVLDANGKVLGQAPATAQGEWMTTAFVPFTATIAFAAPTTPTGTVVFEKDNPSGLPQNEDALRIPVTFGAASTTRNVTLYFYNENGDKDASGNLLCSAKGLVSVVRAVPFSNTPIQDAVRELLKGPTSAEKAAAPNSATPESEFPLAGVSLAGASLSGSVLTLTFSDPQHKTSGGSCRVAVLKAQIEATAKQFGGVSSVRFLPVDAFQP